MNNIYNKNDINNLYIDFYKYVNNIIDKIHESNLSKLLFYCKYKIINNEENIFLPLTICLGGSGYIQYNNIFNSECRLLQLESKTQDYDISFSLTNFLYACVNIKNICLQIFGFNLHLSGCHFKESDRYAFLISSRDAVSGIPKIL